MTKFYFIRHGQQDFSEMKKKIYQGRGFNLMALSEKGIEQVRNTAEDERLKSAEIIISSPFSRALQTSAVLSKKLQIDIKVETDLHEWQSDMENYDFLDWNEAGRRFEELNKYNGVRPSGSECLWEDSAHMKERVFGVLEKYRSYNCVIAVCHGALMQYVLEIPHPENAQIAEFLLK